MANRVLVLAPHADDETLGAGATIAKRVQAGDQVTVAVLTGHGPSPHPVFPPEVFATVREELRAAMTVLGVADVRFAELPAALVADEPLWMVNRVVREMIEAVRPHELLVPFPLDLHRDHRELFHAASVAWRPVTEWAREIRRVACYEVLSETHWNAPFLEAGFLPNRFEVVTGTFDLKLQALRCFKSQMREFPDIRSERAVRALGELRGAQVGAEAAEAFVVVREIS